MNTSESKNHMEPLQKSKNETWDDLPPDAQKSIERGLSQLEKGEGILHEEVMKKYQKWVQK